MKKLNYMYMFIFLSAVTGVTLVLYYAPNIFQLSDLESVFGVDSILVLIDNVWFKSIEVERSLVARHTKCNDVVVIFSKLFLYHYRFASFNDQKFKIFLSKHYGVQVLV